LVATEGGPGDFTRSVKATLILSDYGKPVIVEQPTNVVVLD